MELKVYSIFDSAAQAFLPPFNMQNDGMAIRMLSNTVNDKSEGNNIASHPADYALYRLGIWDDKTAIYIPEEPPQRITLAVELIEDNSPRYSNIDLETLHDEIGDLAKKISGIQESHLTLEVLEDYLPSLLKDQAV